MLIKALTEQSGHRLRIRQAALAQQLGHSTCRNPDAATELKQLQVKADGMLNIVPFDAASIKASEGSLNGVLEPRGLDYLINNAGIVGVSS